MKRIFTYITTVLIAGGFASCAGYLDKEVDLSLDATKVFSKLENTNAFLANTYSHLPDPFSGFRNAQFEGSREAMTDNAISFWSVHYYHSVITDSYAATAHPFSNEFWPKYFQGIRSANTFLTYASEAVVKNTAMEGDNNRLYDRYMAEARLLRAMFHFQLVCWFGPAPIVGDDEEGNPIIFDPTNPDQMNQPRKSPAEVLKWIADECDAIKDALPFRYAQEDINWGRVNGAAAYALKARALLYRASALNNTGNDSSWWGEAATAATDMIAKNATSSNPYRLYTTNGQAGDPSQNYYQCFISPPHLNNEYILCRFEWVTRTFEIELAPSGFAGSVTSAGRLNPTQNLVDSYETMNGLPIDRDPSYDPQNPYANRDPRLEQTILHHGSIWGNTQDEEQREVDVTYGSGLDWKALHGGTLTGYYSKKFLNNMSWKSPTDLARACPLFRYAEVLLNAAEAINEAEGPDRAYQYVNEVRARVGMPPYSGMTKEQLRERIRNERRIELCFEDHRFFDERRWKLFEGRTAASERNLPRYQQVYNYYGVQVSPNASTVFNYTSADMHTQRAFSSPKNYYFPIPDAEIKRLPNLGQNPGWELN
jgi:hypothetical protein